MKIKLSLLVAIILLASCLSAISFQIEKVNEFAITAFRLGSSRATGIVLDEPYLYSLTQYGLETYIISGDGQLTLISRLPVIDNQTMQKINSYIYVGSRKGIYNPYNAKIHKIDVNDPYTPQLVDILELGEEVRDIWSLHRMNNHLLLHTFTVPYSNSYPLLDQDMEAVADFCLTDTPLLVFDDTLVLTRSGGHQYQIYDFSDLPEITPIGSHNVSDVHSFSVLCQTVYQDSILIFNNQREISFWDVSDPDDWELLHFVDNHVNSDPPIYHIRTHIVDNFLLYLNGGYLVIMDLNDYNCEILHLDEPFWFGGADAASFDGYTYYRTFTDGIFRFGFSEGSFNYIESIGEYRFLEGIYYNEDHLFVRNMRPYEYSLIVFDISNPYSIVEVSRHLQGENKLIATIQEDMIVTIDYTDYEFGNVDIFSIISPYEIELKNTIDLSYWPSQPVLFYIDESNTDVLYSLLVVNNTLLKFDISEPGNSELLFSLNIPSSWYEVLVNDGILYCLTKRPDSDWHDMVIYNGLEEDEPFFANSIDYFVLHPLPAMKMTDSYLTVYMSIYSDIYNTYFYSLENPLSPQEAFRINMTGDPIIHNNLLFQGGNSTVYVYDLNGNVEATINPFTHFVNNYYASNMIFKEYDGDEFLFTGSRTSIGVYKFSYELSTDDDIVEIPPVTRLSQNYPNPFNPETKIEFYLEKGGEVKLEIFNIRGQRLAVLIDAELEEGEHSHVWNPKTMAGKDLPSGVYLYRLQTGDYERTRKMLYLK